MEANSDVEVLEIPAKSKHDNKQYRLIRLANEMKVMLVHDDRVHEDKSNDYWPSCALTVAVGSLSDPGDLPGLARYVGNAYRSRSSIDFYQMQFNVINHSHFSSNDLSQR